MRDQRPARTVPVLDDRLVGSDQGARRPEIIWTGAADRGEVSHVRLWIVDLAPAGSVPVHDQRLEVDGLQAGVTDRPHVVARQREHSAELSLQVRLVGDRPLRAVPSFDHRCVGEITGGVVVGAEADRPSVAGPDRRDVEEHVPIDPGSGVGTLVHSAPHSGGGAPSAEAGALVNAVLRTAVVSRMDRTSDARMAAASPLDVCTDDAEGPRLVYRGYALPGIFFQPNVRSTARCQLSYSAARCSGSMFGSHWPARCQLLRSPSRSGQ